MTREEIAEWVGCYFGLQQAINIRPQIEDASGDGGRMLVALRSELRRRMDEIEGRLPPGAIESWPKHSKE
jgi:hypothetical protein